MEILQERLFPQISDFVYNTILDATHENGKAGAWTKWVCQQYLNGHFQSLDDGLLDKVLDLMVGYNKYKSKLKPIMDYKDPNELEDAIIAVNNAGYKTKSEYNLAAKKGAKQIYKDKDFIVLKIENWAAAKKYGANTKWCISTRMDDETFKHYQSKSDDNIYFIIDRHNECKYACVENVCWDEWDDILFAVNSEEDETSGRIGDGAELDARLSENPKLLDIFPYAFPNYKPEDVKKHIQMTITR